MNTAELDALLRETLSDGKLSGSEKEAIAGWAMANLDSEPDRGAARRRAFEAATGAVNGDEVRRVLGWLEEVLKVVHVGPAGGAAGSAVAASSAHFSPGVECLGQIVHRFQAARRTADVCVFTVTDDRSARAMLEAHARGVRLRLITDNDKSADLGSDIDRLRAAGIPVKIDQTPYHMHHKFAIFDAARLLNGSYNWTRGAAEQNEENIVDTGDPRLVAAFQREFDGLWAKL